MKGRSAVAVILILPVTACASLGVKTSGISGPVAWQAVEMNVSGNAVLGQNSSWYSFVLALKETSGSTITFTRVEGSVSAGSGVLRPAERVVDVGRRQPPPHGELRLGPFASRLICVNSPCKSAFHRRLATFYMSGMEHSPTSATGTASERTPWRAVHRAAWEALKRT